jgi:tetratricopeptide (TPR) repeat protein
MNLVIRSRLRQYALLALSAIIVLILVTRAANNWLSYVYAGDPPPKGLKEAMVLEPNNSEFYFLLAQYYDNYDFTTPRAEVSKLYKKSLELNPLNYNYWFYLAEFLSRQGEKEKAVYALNQSTELSPGVVSLRWAAGMLASKLGNKEALLDNLVPVMAYDSDRRNKAFTILWQTLRKGDEIRKVLPREAVPDYMKFLIKTKRVPETYQTWSDHEDLVDYNLYMLMMNFLIYQNSIELAKNAWTDRMGPWDGVWNGKFEKSINNNGFDWTMSDLEGIKITTPAESGKGNSLKIEFDGSANFDFYHFRQVVPVEENTSYTLTSDLKSEDLTTRNGVFWEVYCLHSDDLYTRSEQTYGTTDWHKVGLSFTTPTGCTSAVIRLRRFVTDIDAPFSGALWIDNVELKKSGSGGIR